MTILTRVPDDLAPADEEAALRLRQDATLMEVRDELVAYLSGRVDRESAADLAQEALLRMMKYRDDPQIEDRRAMLYRIVHNLVFQYHRAEKRRHAAQRVPLDAASDVPSDTPSLETLIDARQAIDELLERTIAELPRKCRLAFTLSRFEALTYPQIAHRMGISEKAVDKHISRALLACRRVVGDRDF